jgi:polysaccharide pyruvyl transferase WcaK-like protein
MDNDLSFPSRIWAAVWAAKKLEIPVVIHSVGVGKKWTWLGLKLVRSALICKNIKSIVVRDRVSKVRFASLFPRVATPVLVGPDPALMAGRVYELDQSERSGVGVGVIARATIARHTNGHALAEANARMLWVELCKNIINRGKTVRIFCNGALEDWKEALAVFREVSMDESCREKVMMVDRPVSAVELVNSLNACEIVIAARLHANVVATAVGVPSIGISWDDKVDAFFSDLNIERRCIKDLKNPQAIVDLIYDVLSDDGTTISTIASNESLRFLEGVRVIEDVLDGRMAGGYIGTVVRKHTVHPGPNRFEQE